MREIILMIKIDFTNARSFFDAIGPDYSAASAAHRALAEGRGAGSDFTGWLKLPERVEEGELKSILNAAARIRAQSQALVVIGIGGSYLGAKAAIDLLRSPNHNLLAKEDPKVFFAGNNISADAMNELVEMLGDMDFSVNVISKSGTTLEPALAFRFFKNLLERKYGAGAKKRMYVTTDASRGVLKGIADAEGYETFVVPDDVGGRYSVLSAVGLLPMAVAGIDIKRVITAAKEAMALYDQRSPENPVWAYAAIRQHLYRQGKAIEILTCFDPAFRFMSEWWKQLYGESEGKNGVGIFPASCEFSADLHSMGQLIQDGPRNLFETFVSFRKSRTEYKVPFLMGDADGLNYLAGRNMDNVTATVSEAVKAAHYSGNVPILELIVDEKNEEGFAHLVCFFELACAISGYMLGVNPFDQPGVEAYKINMKRMLGNN